MGGAMYAATEIWLVPLLSQRLGASAHIFGALTIISQLGLISLGAVARQIIVWLGGYSRATIAMCWVQVLTLIALSMPLYHPQESWAIPVALTLCILHGLSGAVLAPAWMTWMAELVPRPLMGRYLAWRWRIFAPTKLVFGFFFAMAIEHWPASHGPFGYQIVLAVAAAGRIASIWLLAKQHVPKLRPALRGADSQRGPPSTVTLWSFIATMHRTDIGRWTLVWTALSFGVLIAGPFFAWYMLAPSPKGLGLDAKTYWWLANTGTVTRFALVAVMGHLVGLYGAAAVLRVAVIGITVVPGFWAATSNLHYLFVAEILSGACWCAAETSVGVLLFCCNRDPIQRVRLIGYNQAVAGVAVVLGTIIGSIALYQGPDPTAAGWLPEFEQSTFRTLCLVSMACRVPALVMAFMLLPTLRTLDARETEGLWRMIPGAGVTMTVGRGLLGVFRRPEG